jgi:carbon monoxide dehydrogenase subunit G
MELTNDFRVSAPPPRAWDVLTDVERIAPMLPGAQLQEIEGDDFRGIVKVKVGPITAQYKGTATFQERNQADGRVVLKASGRDTRGQGNASAIITATLVPDGEGTKVTVVTDLTVTGKVAQFGRGVLADVSAKLIGQFVDALEADLEKGDGPVEPVADATAVIPDNTPGLEALPPSDPAPGLEVGANGVDPLTDAVEPPNDAPRAPTSASPPVESSSAEETPKIRRINSPEPEPVDLLDAAGGSVAKRLLPLLGGFGVLILILVIVRSRRRG